MRRNCPSLAQCVSLGLGFRQTLDAPESLKGKWASRMFFESGNPFVSCPVSERPCPDIRQKSCDDLFEQDSPEHVLEQEIPALIQPAVPGSNGRFAWEQRQRISMVVKDPCGAFGPSRATLRTGAGQSVSSCLVPEVTAGDEKGGRAAFQARTTAAAKNVLAPSASSLPRARFSVFIRACD